jgi:hypothetical protein
VCGKFTALESWSELVAFSQPQKRSGSTAKAVLRAMEGVNGQAAPEPKKPGLRKPRGRTPGNPRRNEGRVFGHTSLSWMINSTM